VYPTHYLRTALALLLGTATLPALAQSAGDWTVGVGIHQVNPKSDNGTVLGGTGVEVGSSARPTFTAEYFLSDAWGVEVLASLPFQHDISLAGMGKIGTTRQLPPTVSLQYHFNPQGKVSPFLGAGVNYTAFFNEDATGALQGSDLSLDNSWGLAAHAGLDFALGQARAVRVDLRWMDIDTDVHLNGAKIGTAQIDPLAYGVSYVVKF